MSVFSKKLIQKELGYDPDPEKNLWIQVDRIYKRATKDFDGLPQLPAGSWYDKLSFIRNEVEKHIEQSVIGNDKFWKGPIPKVLASDVVVFRTANYYRVGIEVSIQTTNSSNSKSYMFDLPKH